MEQGLMTAPPKSELTAQSNGKSIEITPITSPTNLPAQEIPVSRPPSLDTASPPSAPPPELGKVTTQEPTSRSREQIIEDVKDLRDDSNRARQLIQEYTDLGLSIDQLQQDLGVNTLDINDLQTRFPEIAQAINDAKPFEQLTSEQKDQRIDGLLSDLEVPADQAQVIKDAIQEAKTTMPVDAKERGDLVEKGERTKRQFTTRELAGVGMIVILDLALNNGRGTMHLAELITQKMILPEVLTKLGFDEETIATLTNNSHELGRGLFQMDKHSMVKFLSRMSSWEVHDTLYALDEHERQTLLHDGSFGTRGGLFTQSEIKRYFLDKLNDTQKGKLGISIEQPKQ